MNLQIIVSSLIAFVVTLFGAVKYGKYKSDNQNKIDKSKEDADRIVKSIKDSTDAQLKVSEVAKDTRNEITNLPPGSAADELRSNYSRD